jgi:hypothetical protein
VDEVVDDYDFEATSVRVIDAGAAPARRRRGRALPMALPVAAAAPAAVSSVGSFGR